ncbi:MAG: HEAT repeat domain-containing protein [Myxococcaceae bacterium]|nr:HEAT repeat domain-containing protein [Myxococcaceae bacterium]
MAVGVCLVLLTLGTPARAAGATGASCVTSCERHVQERVLRTQLCGRCLLVGSERRTGWLEGIGERQPFPADVVRSAMDDEDWTVAEAAVRAQAAHLGRPVEAVAARWLLQSSGEIRSRACTHVFRFGAAQHRTFPQVRARMANAGGPDGVRAASVLSSCQPKARAALELGLYAMEPREQLEAVRHLAALLGVSPAEAVVAAMVSRSEETDPIAARALLLDAKEGGVPLGRALLRVATVRNQERVNRLVALYAQQIRTIARGRSDPDPLARRGVVAELRPYGPLAGPELEAMLADDDAGVRLAAARAIVEGEGRDFESAVRARLRPPRGAPAKGLSPSVQARWLELYAMSGKGHCRGKLVREVAKDASTPPPVRAAALSALASCRTADAQRVVFAALSSEDTEVRAAAVAALGDAPRSRAVGEAAAKALDDPALPVRLAALEVIAIQRPGGVQARIARLVDDPDARVRAAAVRTLGTIAAHAHVSKVADRLREDADRDVRIAAVEALGELGGPVAIGALTEAAANDPEGRVRYLARQRLGALGFRR